MPEQRQAFQRQLDAIDARVIELLDLLAADLARATLAVPNGNNEAVKVLAEHGLVIDLLCPEVEKLTKTAILLQAPVASDLRFLLCVLRILPELERSHHLVVQLASRASHIRGEDLSTRGRELVGRMGNLASDMWRRAADSWYQRDPHAAGRQPGRSQGTGRTWAGHRPSRPGSRKTGQNGHPAAGARRFRPALPALRAQNPA